MHRLNEWQLTKLLTVYEVDVRVCVKIRVCLCVLLTLKYSMRDREYLTAWSFFKWNILRYSRDRQRLLWKQNHQEADESSVQTPHKAPALILFSWTLNAPHTFFGVRDGQKSKIWKLIQKNGKRYQHQTVLVTVRSQSEMFLFIQAD